MLTPLLLAPLGHAQTRAHAETSITIDLQAAPAAVLPLFGPIREAEWAQGWNPAVLYPAGGRQSAGSVFTTDHEGTDIVWVLTRFDERTLEVEYTQVLPHMWAGEVLVRLRESAPGRTQATVTYRRTALAPQADQAVEAFAHHFPEQREHWQSAINQRLRAIAREHEQHN